MNALVIYDTKYGNTEQVARAIARGLEAAFMVRLGKADQTGEINAEGIDLLVVGGPTHMADVSQALQALLAATPQGALKGIAVAAFDTRYRMPLSESGSAAHKMAPVLEGLSGRLIVPPESFFVVGGEGPLEAGEIQRAAEWGGKIAAKFQRA